MARFIKIRDRNGDKHLIKINNVYEFDYREILKSGYIKDYRNKDYVLDCYSAFDIETTTYNQDISFMYIWQFCFCVKGYYHVIIGRTWDEFVFHMQKIVGVLNGNRLIIWVHNLGFEYQNMFNFLPEHTVFAVKKRMPIKVKTIDNIEFRCSWKLTNMSLSKATRKEKGVIFIKDNELIDYRRIRYPDTKLSAAEMEYNVLDVVSLCDLIKNINVNNDDNLITMPLTSTGYVRRQCRKRIRDEMPKYRDEIFLKNALTADVYNMLKDAARGGNTHANRYYVAQDASDYIL